MADADAAGRNSRSSRPAGKRGQRAAKPALSPTNRRRCDAAHRDPQDGELGHRGDGPSHFPAADRRRCGDPRGQPLPPLRLQGSHPRRADPAVSRRPGSRRRDRIETLDAPDPRPVAEQITELGCAIARCAVEHRAALQMSFYEGPSSDPELMEFTRRPPPRSRPRCCRCFGPDAGADTSDRTWTFPRWPTGVSEHVARRSRRHPTQGVDGRTGHLEKPYKLSRV